MTDKFPSEAFLIKIWMVLFPGEAQEELSCLQETGFWILLLEDPLREKQVLTNSTPGILAWETHDRGALWWEPCQSQKIRHDWAPNNNANGRYMQRYTKRRYAEQCVTWGPESFKMGRGLALSPPNLSHGHLQTLILCKLSMNFIILLSSHIPKGRNFLGKISLPTSQVGKEASPSLRARSTES